MAGLTLDSGALIAVENGDKRVIATIDEAVRAGALLTVPTVVVAQVWRNGSRSAIIARLLKQCDVEVLTEPLARRAGALMTRTGKRDAVDAIVVVSAVQRGDDILTSDPNDFAILANGSSNIRIVPV